MKKTDDDKMKDDGRLPYFVLCLESHLARGWVCFHQARPNRIIGEEAKFVMNDSSLRGAAYSLSRQFGVVLTCFFRFVVIVYRWKK